MFTGIVQAVGRVTRVGEIAGGRRLEVELGELAGRRLQPGDSIAVNGACLTAVDPLHDRFSADLSPETLAATTLGGLDAGSPVNLEPALSLAEPLGGHLVTGHVDGIASVRSLEHEGETARLRIAVPASLRRYIARKGSVCVDGVSLTVNAIDPAGFEVTLVPHTLAHTIMRQYAAGTRVNLEVDLIARYIERLMVDR